MVAALRMGGRRDPPLRGTSYAKPARRDQILPG